MGMIASCPTRTSPLPCWNATDSTGFALFTANTGRRCWQRWIMNISLCHLGGWFPSAKHNIGRRCIAEFGRWHKRRRTLTTYSTSMPMTGLAPGVLQSSETSPRLTLRSSFARRPWHCKLRSLKRWERFVMINRVFWVFVVGSVYSNRLYLLIIKALSLVGARDPEPGLEPQPRSLSVIVAAYNEAEGIREKI